MLGAAAVDSPIAPIEDSVMQFQQNMSNPRGQNFARGQRLDWGWERCGVVDSRIAPADSASCEGEVCGGGFVRAGSRLAQRADFRC